MKIIKTELRNKIGNNWLNHRMTCYIERDVFARIKDGDILYHFQELKARLIKLPTTLRSCMLHPIIISTVPLIRCTSLSTRATARAN